MKNKHICVWCRKYGTKCSGCGEGIPPSTVVRRAQDHVYHVECFACVLCSRKLDTGDEFYLMEDKKLLCKSDYDSAKSKGTAKFGIILSFAFSLYGSVLKSSNSQRWCCSRGLRGGSGRQ